ncbi:hypothetical protein [Paenarthrobacter aurescens]|jgi:hypothetical protein|uniref:Integral membrane protein n=1 Tax=Paenarthrobacter aurescens (strain TC1) TaxID=290340 RepID=A1R1Y0_PAEAT|nr:hypothetical protein [Paenarthrobacter aurescens]ABM06520.1 putative integral membrane protein [Paenarthrobacter aurescens TC1]
MVQAISIRFMIVLCCAFAVLHVVLGIANLDMVASIWPPIIAMLVYLGAVVLALWPGPGRLNSPSAFLILLAVVLMTLLVNSVLPLDTWPGYASWHMAATYTLLVVMNLRRRVALSWCGAAVSLVLTTWWASETYLGIVGGLMLNVATVGWLTIATLIGRLLGANDRQVAEYSADALAAADWYATERAMNVSRTQWIQHVQEIAGPALARIAERDRQLSANDRKEFLLIEAQFRDEIRGRVLATEEVLEAARRARERGVTVRLLDDRRQELAPRLLAAVSERVVSILNQAPGGTVTARARPEGGATAVTILSLDNDQAVPTLVEFPDTRAR